VQLKDYAAVSVFRWAGAVWRGLWKPRCSCVAVAELLAWAWLRHAPPSRSKCPAHRRSAIFNNFPDPWWSA